jgi:hypothetical protein
MLGQNEINTKFIKENVDVFIFEGRPAIHQYLETENPAIASKSDLPVLNSTFTIVKKLPKAGNNPDGYIIEFNEWRTIGRSFLGIGGNALNENIKKARAYNYNDITNKGITADNTINLINFNIETGKKKVATLTIDKANYKNVPQTNANEIIAETKYFFITDEDLLANAKKYNPKPSIDFTFGAIAYLIKVRPSVGKDISSKWTTDLAGGITYGPRFRIKENWGVSVLGGLTLSKINMDSISTRGFVKNKIVEKIALTPTLNLLFSYKNFSFGGALGMDWINDDTAEAASWVYNKKLFWTVGIGFNLFTSGDNQTKTNTSNQ